MPFKMSPFVFWSRVYNSGLALLLLFPPLYRALGLNSGPVLGLVRRRISRLHGHSIDPGFPQSFPARLVRLPGKRFFAISLRFLSFPRSFRRFGADRRPQEAYFIVAVAGHREGQMTNPIKHIKGSR